MHYLPQAPGMHAAVHPGKNLIYKKIVKINKTNKQNKKHLMKLTKRRKGLFRGSQFKTCLPRSILLPALRLLAVYHSYLIFSATALSLPWTLQLPSTSLCSIYSDLQLLALSKWGVLHALHCLSSIRKIPVYWNHLKLFLRGKCHLKDHHFHCRTAIASGLPCPSSVLIHSDLCTVAL